MDTLKLHSTGVVDMLLPHALPNVDSEREWREECLSASIHASRQLSRNKTWPWSDNWGRLKGM